MAVDTSAIPSAIPAAPGRRRWRATRIAYLYLLPVIVSAIGFYIIPFIYTLYISFTNFSLFHFKEYGFVGLENYQRVFSRGSEFLPVLRWTASWMFLTSIFNVGSGMILALLLNHGGLRERNLYRTLLILPWALPNVLLIQVWAGIYNTQGPLNLLIGKIGIERINWLGDVTPARAALLFTNLWLTYPFFMVVGLAALQSIPRELYEVADIDGAGGWSRLVDITMPFLIKAIIPLFITQLAFQFNNAAIVYLLTQGKPIASPGAKYGSTDTLSTFAYKLIFEQRLFGVSAAYSVVIFVFIAVFIVISALATKSFEETD
jgi:arabinogalactan oligomer / maltooligosaccharide transport system permease protein